MEVKERNKEKLLPHALLKFEVHLVEHCNLNCKGCDNFSPIAEKEYLNLSRFEEDMKQLSKLCLGEVHTIHLMGGEPLLHPQVNEFLRISRENFPIGNINLFTNGLLLLQQTDEFWSICKENDINILVTKYPIPFDYDSAEQKARSKQVSYRYAYSIDKDKTLFHFTLDIEGTQNDVDSFLKCHRANDCIALYNGRLYTCSIAANIRHFNKKYGKNLHVSKRDSIDIYEATSIEQILEFLSHPIPFCRYCKINADNKDYTWDQSKNDIEEWT